jgi:hypothetical protein
MLSFNEFIGKEELNKEYKEFTFFKTGFSFDVKESEDYCEYNIFNFDSLILQNLKKYIRQYIPRYTCAFSNSNIEESEFYIGIDDYGMVKGIPVKEDLDIHYLQQKVEKTIKKYVKSDHSTFYVNVELIKVNKPELPKTTIHPEYMKYKMKKEEFLMKYKLFIEESNACKNKYKLINDKLVDIFNIPEKRSGLKKYIQTIDPTNRVIDILDSDYQLEQISGFDMKELKQDKNNPYYWVTEYKDSVIHEYKKNKPVFIDFFRLNTPYNLLISVGEMIPYWMNYNKDMKLFVIKINIRCKKDKNDCFYYFDKKWLKCHRVYRDNEPMCLPID